MKKDLKAEKKLVFDMLEAIKSIEDSVDHLIDDLEFDIDSKTVNALQTTSNKLVDTTGEVLRKVFNNDYGFESEIAWYFWETVHNKDGNYAVGYKKTKTGTKKYNLKTFEDLWRWWKDSSAFVEGSAPVGGKSLEVHADEEELDAVDAQLSVKFPNESVQEYCAFCGSYHYYANNDKHMSICRTCNNPIVLCNTCKMERCAGCKEASNWEER